MNQGASPKPPGPSFRDWAMLAISVTFVVMGCVIARSSPRDALFGLAFFGVCALTFGFNIYRKIRRRRFTATTVLAPGGVELRASNFRMLGLAAMIGIPGVTSFFVEAPLLIRICGWIMVGAAALLLFLVLTGRVSRRFIRFDPLGVTLGEPKFEYTVPWDELDDIEEFEMYDNAVVGFVVRDPGLIQVAPEGAHDRVYKLLGKNEGWTGRHVIIMVGQFAITAEALCAALRNYAGNAQARADLVRRPQLGSGTDS
jgi:hypothetical protein